MSLGNLIDRLAGNLPLGTDSPSHRRVQLVSHPKLLRDAAQDFEITAKLPIRRLDQDLYLFFY